MEVVVRRANVGSRMAGSRGNFDMMAADASAVPSQIDLPEWDYGHIDIEYDAPAMAMWMIYSAAGPLCYTPQTLKEMIGFRESLRAMFKSRLTDRFPVRYLVIASRKQGVFNLGGDLRTFAAAIRAQESSRLREYAHACIDLIDSLLRGLDLPIVTISAVHGQCLGGAFEASLATDYILAEETARFALPEITFNTFPGMGAVSLLTRKLGAAMASKILLEGRTYSAREMFEMEAIDAVAPEGKIRQATRNWIVKGGEDAWTRRRVLAEARRRTNSITRDELIRITDLWADCSKSISEADLRHMERIANAQSRLFRSADSRKRDDQPDPSFH